MERQLEFKVLQDLQQKMVFLVGPRQAGKTWLAKRIASKIKDSLYLNYDDLDHREIILERSWIPKTTLIVFDELHKMPDWKNYLKGIFDTKPSHRKILVTGNARMNTFKKAGDSLVGRYFKHRLLPFTHNEISQNQKTNISKLLHQGGFPEAYLSQNDDEANRWRHQYTEGLIRYDILDFEKIHDFRAIDLIFKLLQRKVGSPISYKSLAEDAQISPITVKKYIEIFESLYMVFKVTPYSKNIARSILKEPKIYFFDNGLVQGDQGAKFENLVAVELLKMQLGKEDLKGIPSSLNYLRTKEKKEVDFCLVENDEIKELIEVKFNEKKLSKNLIYFCEKYQLRGTQLLYSLNPEFEKQNIQVRNFSTYFES